MSNNIQQILRQGEGLKAEFKTSFNVETIETLVAFVNSKGGAVYIGVNNNGEITGVQLGTESIQQWTNEIKSKTEPSIIPDVEVIESEEKNVVVFIVNEFPVKPVAIQGKYYKRVDKSNHLLSISEISDMYMRTMQYSWDAYFSRDYSIEDIDFKKVQKFIDRVNSIGRFSLEGSPTECLRKLKYISEDKVTNAAILLFGKGECPYNVHLGRFKTESMIIDDRMLRLTLFDAVEETQKYLISQMKVAFEITGKTTQRTEILEYPVPAIRELILNCLIHRDYLSPIDVQIKVFDNFITFYNPGKLYGDLTIEDLYTTTYQASTRNKLIADAFYLTGDIEKYGSGFRRIRNEIKQYPTMKHEFHEIANGFLATVSYTERKISLQDVEKDTDDVTENFTNSFTDNFTDNLKKILELIESKPTVTFDELAEKVGITKRAIINNTNKLKRLGLIERIGTNKRGYWRSSNTTVAELEFNRENDLKFNKQVNELTSDNFTDNFTNIFTNNVKKILELIESKPTITLDELAEKVGITKRAIINNTNKLKKTGLLERTGGAKGDYWKVNKRSKPGKN
jgi:ATP-dependent DNA helicase RecG